MKSLSSGLVLLILLLGVACGKPAPVPQASPTSTTSIATTVPQASPVPSPTVAPTPKMEPTPSANVTPAAFFLEVMEPANESVVRASPVRVLGRTVPDAVVSVNGQPVEVDASGNFSTTVSLEEGPNSIEVLTSDFQGHQEAKVISVIFVR